MNSSSSSTLVPEVLDPLPGEEAVAADVEAPAVPLHRAEMPPTTESASSTVLVPRLGPARGRGEPAGPAPMMTTLPDRRPSASARPGGSPRSRGVALPQRCGRERATLPKRRRAPLARRGEAAAGRDRPGRPAARNRPSGSVVAGIAPFARWSTERSTTMPPPRLRGSPRFKLVVPVVLGAIVALGVVLRFVQRSPLWLDEALSVNIAACRSETCSTPSATTATPRPTWSSTG